MTNCNACGHEITNMLDFGLQPITNRYVKDPASKEKLFPLRLGACKKCGLVQLMDFFPVNEVKPRYEWITYNEPERHLDEVADIIAKLPGITKQDKIGGVSFKDISLLARLKDKGFCVSSLDYGSEINLKSLGTETIQGLLDPDLARDIIKRQGLFNTIIVRHLVEHTYDLKKFIESLTSLVKPGGYVIIEVPNFKKSFENRDYSAVWEEHTIYFTEETFRMTAQRLGLDVQEIFSFPYVLEDCLVLIARVRQDRTNNNAQLNNQKDTIDSELLRIKSFSDDFKQTKEKMQKFFKERKNIFLFGAGHSACVFINIFELKKYISGIIDDNEFKQNLFMPGSMIPITGSGVISSGNAKTVVLSINPDVEEKIVSKNLKFIQQGGEFFSMCPLSKYSILKKQTHPELKQHSEGVYYSSEKIIKINAEQIDMIKDAAKKTKLKRARICTHKSSEDAVNEMIIALEKNTYIRPHKHLGKTESFHVIEGSAIIVMFDDEGNITDLIDLGEKSSGKTFYYRLNTDCFHSVIILSDFLVYHETTKGPFKKEDTIFSPWSPEEGNNTEEYLLKLHKEIKLRLRGA